METGPKNNNLISVVIRVTITALFFDKKKKLSRMNFNTQNNYSLALKLHLTVKSS